MTGIGHLKEFQEENLNKVVDALEKENNEASTVGNRFLPTRNVYSNNFAYDVIKKKTHIASYIGFGAEPAVVDRDAVAKKHGELAKLGLKHIVTEEELLSIHQARSNAENKAMVDQLVAKGVDLVNAVYLQIEVSRLQALFKGSFGFDDNNVKIGIDYGVPEEHQVVKTGTNAWSDTAESTPISDLIAWNDQYVEANGRKADVVFMSREVRGLMQQNAEVIAEARGANAGSSSRVSVGELEDILTQYDLPPVEIVNQRSVTVHNIYKGAEETIEYMPKFRVTFASEGLGEYQMGITVENNFAPGVNLRAYDKNEPIQSVMRTVAAGFPVIEDPELLFYADVATP